MADMRILPDGRVSVWHLNLATRALRAGGIVLHATEGVWGLACDPFNPDAVYRLLAIKRRPVNKGLILIGDAVACFEPELEGLNTAQRSRVEDSWPGPVTWVLPQRRFPAWITGSHDRVAVRVPGHPLARALSRSFGGALVSTSANIGGRPAVRSRLQARRFASARLRPDMDYLLPGEVLGGAGPSEIRTLEGATLRPAIPVTACTADSLEGIAPASADGGAG